MANIIVNDIFDELREEIIRFSNENKVICDLLDKYRKCLLNVHKMCECSHKYNNQILIESLENDFNKCLDQKIQEKNEINDNLITDEKPLVDIKREDQEQTDETKDIVINVINDIINAITVNQTSVQNIENSYFKDNRSERTDTERNESSAHIKDNNLMTTNEDINQSVIETKGLVNTSKTKNIVCDYKGLP